MYSVEIKRLRVAELMCVASVELEFLRVVGLEILRECAGFGRCARREAVYGRFRRGIRARSGAGYERSPPRARTRAPELGKMMI